MRMEHVIIPEARKNIKYITMKLDENERSTESRPQYVRRAGWFLP